MTHDSKVTINGEAEPKSNLDVPVIGPVQFPFTFKFSVLSQTSEIICITAMADSCGSILRTKALVAAGRCRDIAEGVVHDVQVGQLKVGVSHLIYDSCVLR
jgi:hypothetical protein